jgi:8-oxo-dGTP diphosphatase
VERGESFLESAVREVKEETGLNVANLKSCGVIHWINPISDERCLAFLYKTTEFSGELLSSTREGRNRWVTVAELQEAESTNSLHEILYMFLQEEYSEAVGSWTNGEDWSIDGFR